MIHNYDKYQDITYGNFLHHYQQTQEVRKSKHGFKKRIELQEDIWSFCLDTLKWDTKKIICQKAYLEEKEFLAKSHVSQFDELKKGFDKPDE